MTYFPPADPLWNTADPKTVGLDPAKIAAAAGHAGEHETKWSRDLAHMVATDFGEEPPWNEALGPVRPRGGPNGLIAAPRADRRILGGHPAGRPDFLGGQELPVDPRRDCPRPRHDPRSRRAGAAHGRRWRLRPAAQRRDHVAAFVAADLRMGGHAVGQAGPDRPPSPDGRASADRQEGRSPRPANARQLLGIQRRPRQPAEPLPAASVAPPAARGIPRTGDGPDRRVAQLGVARIPQFVCRDRRQADAVGLGRFALGRRHLYRRARPGARRAC